MTTIVGIAVVICIFVGVMLVALIVTMGDLVFKAVRNMKALRRQ